VIPIHWSEPVDLPHYRATVWKGSVYAEIEYPSGSKRVAMFAMTATSQQGKTVAAEAFERDMAISERGLLRMREGVYRPIKSLRWIDRSDLNPQMQFAVPRK
jgi:hypothetical protein